MDCEYSPLEMPIEKQLDCVYTLDKMQERPCVFLCEVLQVRCESLTESELWSVLSQAVEVIQDIFLQKNVESRLSKMLITPSSLTFTCTGKVKFLKSNYDEDENFEQFVPPEFNDTGGELNEECLEKIFIYSLGQTLKYAANYPNKLIIPNDNSINLSSLLNSTLHSMCQDDAFLRKNVLNILEIISENIHTFTENKPFTHFIGGLYREVLGLRICINDTAKDYNLFINQRMTNGTVKRSESTVTCRSENDKYGRRLGYHPRCREKISVPKRSNSDVATLKTNHESNKHIICGDLMLSESLTRDRRRLVEILQLDVNVRDSNSLNEAERIRSKSLADVNCGAAETYSKIRNKNSTENISSKIQSQCDITKHKSKMILSRPTFRSTVYDMDNYPKLIRCRKSSFTKTPKNIIGPEFVVMSSKPNLPLTLNIKSKEVPGNHVKHLKQIIIVLLNGRRLETNCDLTVTKVEHVWDAIVSHEKFNRKFLYGLAYIKDGEFIFLESEQKLQKIVSPGWTEWRGSNQMDVTSFTVYVRVKFYINHNLIRDKMSRHLHYLQLRRDILEERTRCDPQKAIFLASLALQAEFNDYDENVFGKDYFFVDHYLSPSAIKYFGQDNAKRQLITLHGARKGVSEDLAVNEFIEAIEKLPEYGFHFHTIQQGKKAKKSKLVCLGISTKGIGLFRTSDSREKEKFFEWKTIQRITYDEKHLYLTIFDEKLNKKKEKLKFYTDKAKNRYLFNIATAHHRLHLMLDCNVQIPDLTFQDDVQHKFENATSSDHEISYELRRDCDQYEDCKTVFEYEQVEDEVSGELHKDSAFVLGTSFGPPKNWSQFCDEEINNSLACRFENLGNTSVNEKRLVATTLHRSSIHGFGLSVTLGDDQGIYIQSILPQSPAELSRVLHQGDRIFSVNQILVDCMEYKQVLDLIRECKDKIDIVVSQQIPIHELSTIKEELEISALKTFDFENDNSFENENNQEITSSSKLNSVFFKIPPFEDNFLKEKESNFTSNDVKIHSCDQSCHEGEKNISCFDFEKCNGECEIIKYQKFVEKLQNGKETQPSNSTLNQIENTHKNESDNNAEKEASINNDSIEKMRCDPLTENEVSEVQFNEDEECDQIKVGDIFHIVLEKNEGSLGINIKGGVNSSGTEKNILVQQVIPGGAAYLDGRIKVGDVILEVNGTNLTNATHQQAVESLRTTSPLAHLTLRRSTTPTAVVRVHSTSNLTTTTPLPTQQQPGRYGLTSSSSAIFTRPESRTSSSIQRNLSLKNSVGNSCKLQTNNSSMPSASSNQSFKTTIQLNTRSNPVSSSTMNGNTTVRRNSSDNWGTRISFGNNESANVIRLRVNFGEDPSSGVLRRSLSTDLKSENQRRRSSLEWVPSTDSTVKVMSTQGVGNHVFTHTPGCNYTTGVGKTEHVVEESCDAKNRKKLTTHQEEDAGMKSVNGDRNAVEYKTRANTDPLPSIPDMSTGCVNVMRQNGFETKSRNNENRRRIDDEKEEQVPVQVAYPFITEENTFDVTLVKNSRGLGLSVCGGWDADLNDSIARLIRIKRLYPLQPAVQCGKLQIGDIVLAVNQQSLLGLMYFEAIEILRMASNPINLTICRPEPDVIPPIPQSSSLLATAPCDESDNVPRYNGPTYTEFDITLTKVAGSLGFTLVKLEGPNAGHYIKALVKEPALSDGQLQPGDKIILVNGIDISDMSHSESITFLRELPDEVTLCVWRQVVPPSSPTSPTSPTAPSFPDDLLEKKLKPKPLLRKEALDMLNDKSRPKGCRKNLNGGSPLASPRIRRKQVKDGGGAASSDAAAEMTTKDGDVSRDEREKNLRVGSNVSSSRSTSESSTSGIEKGTSSSDRSYSSPVLIPGQSGSSVLTSSPESPGKPQRPSYLELNGENLSPRKQKFGRAPHRRDLKEDDLMGDEEESEESSYIRYFDSGDSLLATDDGLTTVTSSEGSPIQMGGQSALLKWRGAKLASQEDVGDICEENGQDGSKGVERKSSIITVDLHREGNSRLGLSLVSMETNDATGTYVKVVYPGSLAQLDGRIQVGDKLLQINDTDVRGMAVDEAIDLLRNQNGKVSLVLERETETLKDNYDIKNHDGGSLGRSWSEQENLLSNEVSLLNAKNNNLSSADCLHWNAMTSDRNENENYANDS